MSAHLDKLILSYLPLASVIIQLANMILLVWMLIRQHLLARQLVRLHRALRVAEAFTLRIQLPPLDICDAKEDAPRVH